MPKTPKYLIMALIHCENYDCQHNNKGRCKYGIDFRVKECSEYAV